MFRRERRAARLSVGALIIPVRQDSVVVSGPRQRTDVNPVNVRGDELGVAVGRHIHPVKGLVIRHIIERQADKGCAVIGVITDIRRPWFDAATDLRYIVMVLRRTTFYGVIACEGRIKIPSYSSNRPAPMLAVTLPPKLKCTVKRAVMLPLTSWTLVTLPPALPVRVRSLVWTDPGSTA